MLVHPTPLHSRQHCADSHCRYRTQHMSKGQPHALLCSIVYNWQLLYTNQILGAAVSQTEYIRSKNVCSNTVDAMISARTSSERMAWMAFIYSCLSQQNKALMCYMHLCIHIHMAGFYIVYKTM